MKKSLVLLMATGVGLSLSGCQLDGENGVIGATGNTGATGASGADGENLVVSVGKRATKVDFSSLPTPTTATQKTQIQVSSNVTIGNETQAVKFTKLMATGDTNNSETFGRLKDFEDNPISFSDGSPYICNGTNSGVGSGLDFSSILNKNNKLYMVSQFECQIGAMYVSELEQNAETGDLSVKANTLSFISQKDDFGGFVHCAGQATPWQSHLGSEEYEPDARTVETTADATTGLTGNKYYDEVAKFWGGDIKKASPYYYGWTPEVSIGATGTASYAKHYSMGRFSHELAYVMPDKKTVFMSDDGTNVGLFMYVADTAGDLSEGTIYAAKWTQINDVSGGRADISWINLGHATDAEIKSILNADNDVTTNDAPLFSNIFSTATPDAAGACAAGFTSINATPGQECLKIKTQAESGFAGFANDAAVVKAAAFLETRRYAALKGATTEFRKEEGITFDAEHNKLYVAMSEVARGMENNQKLGVANTKYDIGGNNDIKLPNNSCGAVYAMDVATSGMKDTDGTAINSAYAVNNMYSIINGIPKSYDAASTFAGNSCDVDGISNPDNVTYLEGSNLLFIGEDTSKHKNNIVWALDVENGALKRVLSTPEGAETTSPFWYKNINGFAYMTAVSQHPSGASASDKESVIGVIGPIKNLATLNGSKIVKVGAYNSGKDGGSEISAFDPISKKLFITNGADNKLDVVSLENVHAPTLVTQIDLSSYGASVQSVAVNDGNVAVAVGTADNSATKGSVLVFNTDGVLQSRTQVGFLPDMVTFNLSGSKIVVANEAEPKDDYTVDPSGTVGVITVATATTTDDATGYAEVDFSAATLTNALDGTAVRLGGTPSNDKAKDIEPEYITMDGDIAYVTLQENNALAKIDVSGATPTIIFVKSFGAKSYQSVNKIDIEEEGKIKLKSYPELYGLYQPDTISSYQFGGSTYLVTANEGDGRDYSGHSDEKKIKKLTLDGSISAAYDNENDLKVMTDLGDDGLDGDYEKLYAFGARSVSIWDEDGDLVWDSGFELAKLTASFEPRLFNQSNGELDGRSGNKGVEPEALTIGNVDGKTYAFIGLERQNAIVIYDISNPYDAKFVSYTENNTTGDISPEGMVFVPAAKSPNSKNLLIVSYEVSGSTVIYEVK